MDLSFESIILFFAFVVISYLFSRVQSAQAKTKAVETVNDIAKDAYSELRSATKLLLSEGGKRARLEGQMMQLMRQLNTERQRADSTRDQITQLYNDMQKVNDQLDNLETQLARANRDKERLAKELAEVEANREELINSVPAQIDAAVSAVRDKMRQHYENKIDQLERLIEQKDYEIAQLKSQLRGQTHHEIHTTHPDSNLDTDDADDDAQSQPDHGTGDNT
ncbi:MAG: hypothetical protein ACFE0Q_20855 [Anaerolineae bacterium]